MNTLILYNNKKCIEISYDKDDIDKNKLDISILAQYIVDEDMGPRKKSEYLDGIWDNNDDNLLRLFFGRKIFM